MYYGRTPSPSLAPVVFIRDLPWALHSGGTLADLSVALGKRIGVGVYSLRAARCDALSSTRLSGVLGPADLAISRPSAAATA